MTYTAEDKKKAIARHMALIDALTPGQRAIVHEYGWRIVDTMLRAGVSDPETMTRIITVVRAELRKPE